MYNILGFCQNIHDYKRLDYTLNNGLSLFSSSMIPIQTSSRSEQYRTTSLKTCVGFCNQNVRVIIGEIRFGITRVRY